MNEATGDTRDEKLVVDDELNDRVDLLLASSQHRVQLLSLGNRPWETVEDKAKRKEQKRRRRNGRDGMG